VNSLILPGVLDRTLYRGDGEAGLNQCAEKKTVHRDQTFQRQWTSPEIRRQTLKYRPKDAPISAKLDTTTANRLG